MERGKWSKVIEGMFDSLKWPLDLLALKKCDLRQASLAILGIVALKTRLLFFLNEKCRSHLQPYLTAPVKQEIVSPRGLRHSIVSEKESLAAEETGLPQVATGYISLSEPDLLRFFQKEEIRAGSIIPNKYMTFHLAVHSVNSIIAGLHRGDEEMMMKVAKFIEQPPNMDLTYFTGNVHVKTPHTYLVSTEAGSIQIGMPTDTIKDSMQSKEEIPQIYILPPSLFTFGTNEVFAEVEFPIYFNFFVRGAFLNPDRRIIIIGDEEHLTRVRTLFQESIFGPMKDELFNEEEISPERKQEGYTVDLDKETKELGWKQPDGRPVNMDLFVDFKAFSSLDNSVEFSLCSKGKEKEKEEEGGKKMVHFKITSSESLLNFYENGEQIASLGLDSTPHVHSCRHHGRELLIKDEETPEGERKSFSPPPFGVTFLGTGHGFDAFKPTTGFIVWVKGRGIAVDPPVGTIQYLREKGIPLAYLSKAILTHVHADHDGGLLQLIMAGKKIEVFSTKTVHRSYLRKLRAVTGLKNIESYYYQRCVTIGKDINILGAMFEFDYSYHSIPTVRFYCSFGGKSIAYSADTFYDPVKYSELREKGVFNTAREMALNQFLWGADLVIHENGVPPIHTSAAVLNSLPASIKKKILIVHTSGLPKEVKIKIGEVEKTIPVTHLKIPACGVANTVSLDVAPFISGFSSGISKFVLISNIGLFRQMPPQVLLDILTEAEERVVPQGQIIVSEGEPSDSFYIILSGTCQVESTKNKMVVELRMGDVFGESVFRHPKFRSRLASIVATTTCTLLVLPSSSLDRILESGDVIKEDLDIATGSLSSNRPFVQTVLSNTFIFQGLTLDQLNAVAAALGSSISIPKGHILMKAGEIGASMFVLQTGSLSVRQAPAFSPLIKPRASPAPLSPSPLSLEPPREEEEEREKREEEEEEEDLRKTLTPRTKKATFTAAELAEIKLHLRKTEGREREREIMRKGPGSVVGEMSLLSGARRSATVVAAEDCVVFELTKENFVKLLNENQTIRLHLMFLADRRKQENDLLSGRRSGSYLS